MVTNYCCAMRRYFLVGIVGTLKGESAPIETADFVVAWEPKIVVKIKYCPFCGKEIRKDEELRAIV